MGCLFSRFCFQGGEPLEESLAERPNKPQYSWDKERQNINVNDFIIDGIKNETVGRQPGEVNGQQMIIQNCENCNIYIFDHSATITVDDCIDCNLFLGPIKTSVFLRDCKNCNVAVICQQFRTRDCSKMNIYLCCGTQPIIEASTGMKFGCFQYNYPQLKDQFKAAGLSVFNNNWSNIHDFTPVPGENNFGLLTEDMKLEECIPLPTKEPFSSLQITTEKDTSVVPYTLGSRRKTSNESCLVVFFNDGGSSQTRAESFIGSLLKNGGFKLAQSKEVTMQPDDSGRVFGSDSYRKVVEQGPVIGLEVNGEGCIKYCQDTVVDILQSQAARQAFVSSSQSAAAQHIDNFYNFADMQMGL